MVQAELKFAAISGQLGCNTTAQVKACMLNKTWQQVLAATHFPEAPSELTDWSVTVDGVEFTDYPEILASKGHFADVPVMLGAYLHRASCFCV